jgi:glutathione S-transferase
MSIRGPPVRLSYESGDGVAEGRREGTEMIVCYAFGMVPPFARGLVRDLRVRWALEEAGLPYRVTLVGDREGEMPPSEYRRRQPFGQIPAIEDGDLTLFESGAIVLYVAERTDKLLPTEGRARARVHQWMFAALNTIEFPVMELAGIDLFWPDEGWAKERRPAAVEAVRKRLGDLATSLDGRDHLVGAFSAADVLMVSVLRILRHTNLVAEHPALLAYEERCEARPAFKKALADQMAPFQEWAARG